MHLQLLLLQSSTVSAVKLEKFKPYNKEFSGKRNELLLYFPHVLCTRSEMGESV